MAPSIFVATEARIGRAGLFNEAHILICFLAYVMWRTLQQWQARAGLGDSPRTILTELSRIQSADIILPLANRPEREMRLRCIVRPEREQAILLQRLGLRLPQRLTPPKAVPVEMQWKPKPLSP
jgi:hypothetical protein